MAAEETKGREHLRTLLQGSRLLSLGVLVEDRPYDLESAEVAEAFEVPCGDFLLPDRWGYRSSNHKLARFRSVPYFNHDEQRVVWGLTGIILRDFVQQVMGWAPPVG